MKTVRSQGRQAVPSVSEYITVEVGEERAITQIKKPKFDREPTTESNSFIFSVL